MSVYDDAAKLYCDAIAAGREPDHWEVGGVHYDWLRLGAPLCEIDYTRAGEVRLMGLPVSLLRGDVELKLVLKGDAPCAV